jgi:hypothetical protein
MVFINVAHISLCSLALIKRNNSYKTNADNSKCTHVESHLARRMLMHSNEMEPHYILFGCFKALNSVMILTFHMVLVSPKHRICYVSLSSEIYRQNSVKKCHSSCNSAQILVSIVSALPSPASPPSSPNYFSPPYRPHSSHLFLA